MSTSTVMPRARSSRAPPLASTSSHTSRVTKTQSTKPSHAKQPRQKRPATQTVPSPDTEVVDLTNDANGSAKKPPAQNYRGYDSSNERRTRRWRAHPPQTYLERLERIRQTKFADPPTPTSMVFIS